MDWTVILLAVIIGGVSGFVIARILDAQTGSENAAAAKNQQLSNEFNQYKQDVEQHFANSAEMLGDMAQQYSKIYQHMAQSQQNLLPESELSIKIPFVDAKEPSLVKEAIEEVELEVAANQQSSDSDQPNDYVSGTHGIINSDRPIDPSSKKSA